MKEIACL